jgi:TfoX/Sxy family transcriptional regulator of competence genes
MTDGSDRPGSPGGSAMPKPSPEAIERFRRVAPEDPRVSLRPMFGNLAAFANGYLFAGLFGDAVFVRLDDAGQASIIEQGGTPFAPMPGRPMRGYVVLPDAWGRDDAMLRPSVEQSLAHTLALPPKAAKAKTKSGKGGGLT